MTIAVELPSLGESVYEGTVSRWLVTEGDMVEVDQPIVEVTTDKVDAEIPAPSGGLIEQILVAEGEVVEVGAVLARIDPDAKAGTAPSSEPAAVPPPAAGEPEPVRAEASVRTSDGSSESPRSITATPVARRMAEDADIDLQEVRGTGSAGRVTKEDIIRHQGSSAMPPATEIRAAAPAIRTEAPAPPLAQTRERSQQAPRRRAGAAFGYELQPGDRVIPMSPMRRIISDHMVYSKRTSPHVGTVAEVDLSSVVRLRRQKKKAFEASYGVGLTFLPFIVHATVRALREFPALNASVVEDAIVEKQDVHVGVATETEKGLVVPVIRNADRLSLAGTAMAIHELATRARDKRLSADDLKGGTFTVSNPGRKGNLYGFAIINQPQVGILRMGEIAKRAVVRTLDGEDAIVIRTMMYMALSYDHRAVDGAPANGFLHRIRELLEAAEFDL
ncbi:MAG: dihydrolipoyllysine acetyltransferase [Deltaproteobacteria bacterium]|nr:dihydrolipoyllysine acetyltransferase [Deltaproteobacteria bacterium]